MTKAFEGPMFEYLLPEAAEVRPVSDLLAAHQAAIEFQREVEHRQAFEDYCQWYYKLAAQNQAEMRAMQNDAESFLWWLGRSNNSEKQASEQSEPEKSLDA